MQHYWDWFCALPVAISVHYTLTEMRKTVSTHMHVHHIWCNVEPSSYNMTLPSATLQLLIAFKTIFINLLLSFVFTFVTIPPSSLHHTDLGNLLCQLPTYKTLFWMNCLQKKAKLVDFSFFSLFCPPSHLVSSICTADNIRAVTDILWRTTFLFYIYFLRNVESLKTDFTSLQTQWNNQCLLFCAEALWVFLLNKSNQLIYNNDIILLIA